MSRSRKVLLIGIFLVLGVAGALLLYQRATRPSRAVLALPESNFLLYVNLKAVHLIWDTGKPLVMEAEPEYQEFVRQTGFHFDRDLNEVAISQRNSSDPDTDSSAIFVGHFDQNRVRQYLQKLSTATERYADKEIFSIPHERHLVRACVLENDRVAITNMDSPEPMRSIIDKSRSWVSVRRPYLLENYYRQVPVGSLAWLIYRNPSQPGAAQLPGGFSFSFLDDTVSVTSLRYDGSLSLKSEIFSQNEAEARKVSEAATTFVALFRDAGQSLTPRGTDPDVKSAFESLQIRQQGNRTIFTASIPLAFFKKMLEERESTVPAQRK